MSSRNSILKQVLVVLGIGSACFLIFLMLIPNIEASSTEARLTVAYYQVRRISEAYLLTPSDELFTTHEIPEEDPWGQRYRLIEVDVEHVRALSCGPNMRTPEVGFDQDDIYSDMPESPVAPIHAAKKLQFTLAIGVSAVAWLLLSAGYLWQSGQRIAPSFRAQT